MQAYRCYANFGVPKVTKGLIACVILNVIIAAINSGKKAGRAAADRYVIRALRRLSPQVKLVAAVERNSRTFEELVRHRQLGIRSLTESAMD